MIDLKDLNTKSESLRAMLRSKYGVRGKTLEAGITRAGRHLPKHIRREARVITEAEALPPHPKLVATVDSESVSKAYEVVRDHLNGIDPKDRRRGKLLSWLGGQVFNLILIVSALIAVLLWRGYLG